MARQEQQARAQVKGIRPGSLQPRILYLTAYNLLFAALWVIVGITAIRNASGGKFVLFGAVEPLARWVQTFTMIEVVHAAIRELTFTPGVQLTDDVTGLVKSPVSTTAIQVFTRVIQVWMIWYSFPASTAVSNAFFVLVLAWSIADSIRYSYLALNLHGKAPQALVWLRYVRYEFIATRTLIVTATLCSTHFTPLVSGQSGC